MMWAHSEGEGARTPMWSSRPPGKSTISLRVSASSTSTAFSLIFDQISVAARRAPTYSSSLVRKYRWSFCAHGSCSSSAANFSLNRHARARKRRRALKSHQAVFAPVMEKRVQNG